MSSVWSVQAGAAATCRARLKQPSGEALAKDDVATVWVEVFQAEKAGEVKAFVFAPDLDATLFDDLQQDEAWPHEKGYTVKLVVPGEALAKGNTRFIVRITFEIFSDEDDEAPPYPLRKDWILETDSGAVVGAPVVV